MAPEMWDARLANTPACSNAQASLDGPLEHFVGFFSFMLAKDKNTFLRKLRFAVPVQSCLTEPACL